MSLKILVASDSFKGTLSSSKICSLFSEEAKKRNGIEIIKAPIADGGEGSLEALSQSIKGKFHKIKVTNYEFKDIETEFYLDFNNNAYIEVASCCALNELGKKEVSKYTTVGLGEQIKEAINLGCKRIYLFLGGSGTNDGGTGIFASLGTKFFAKDNKEFIPVGESLKDIVRIDISKTETLLEGIEIIGLCDVKNPFFGRDGAAYIFGPQKGANPKTVQELDDGLKHLSKIILKDLKVDISKETGAGAAGGIGGGLIAFSKAKLCSGAETLLRLMNFSNLVKEANYVVSGEGKFDEQTLSGKAVSVVASYCKENKKPLHLIVGISETNINDNDIKIMETNPHHLPFKEVKERAEEDYRLAINRFFDEISKEAN